VTVEIDTSAVERGIAQLVAGLTAIPDRVPIDTARTTAAAIRSRVPVRSGRLRGTVDAVPVSDGAAVTYGGTLPYARYIERRARAVESAVGPSAVGFVSAMTRAAEREVARL
jgi:hypothetical protein